MTQIEFRAFYKFKDTGVSFMAKVCNINFMEGCAYLRSDKPFQTGWYKLSKIKLMQYIEAKDKNKTKIFEGDIVKCSLIDSFNRIVESIAYVTKDKCSYKLVKISGDGLNLDDINLWIDAEEENAFIEVIGNIYQNKELLENKEVN